MSKSQQTPRIQLPKGWKKQVRSALRHVLSLVQYAAVYSRGWAADSTNTHVRPKAELSRGNPSAWSTPDEYPARLVLSPTRVSVRPPANENSTEKASA